MISFAQLNRISGDKEFGPDQILVKERVDVGQTFDVAVEMKAPTACRDEPYSAEYQM